MKILKKIIFVCGFILFSQFALAEGDSDGDIGGIGSTCDGRWVNPITDVCWKCLFPMSIGNTQVSASGLPDTRNPSSPIQRCPFPPPIFQRIGIAIGFWEPYATTDISRSPMCMVNMGGMKIGGLKKSTIGSATATGSKARNGTFYHVHWYKYPLISWLGLFSDDMCMQGGSYDIAYLSELDPMWNDDTLSLFVNPEAALFGNPIAQFACIADAIAAEYNVKLIEVLTGFKYIGEQIKFFEQQGTYEYEFGFEESYGCLVGTHARDKDAVVAVMALCEAAAYYKTKNMTLWDQMIQIFEKYGYYKEGQKAITMKGAEGAEKIAELMDKLRNETPKKFGSWDVLEARDYKKDECVDLKTGEKKSTGLPSSNVLYYALSDNAWCCARPSGTEPKIKFYMGVKGSNLADADAKLEELTKAVMEVAGQQ